MQASMCLIVWQLVAWVLSKVPAAEAIMSNAVLTAVRLLLVMKAVVHKQPLLAADCCKWLLFSLMQPCIALLCVHAPKWTSSMVVATEWRRRNCMWAVQSSNHFCAAELLCDAGVLWHAGTYWAVCRCSTRQQVTDEKGGCSLWAVHASQLLHMGWYCCYIHLLLTPWKSCE